jgi:UDP-3-O-[3-hydroxymyristoyl] glucosamine N-acyltransferase
MKLGELAERLGCTLEGPGEVEITGITGMDEACESEVTFFSNPKYQRKLQTTHAAAIIVAPGVEAPGRTLLRSDNPYLTFAQAIEVFAPPSRPKPGIHPTAVITPGSKIGRNPSIGPYVVIEDSVRVGDDCVLKSFVMIYRGAVIGDRFVAHSHAVVRENVRIGNDVMLQNGAVLGADGFGFAKQADGSYYKIVPSGVVVIEDGVEVQAHSCIDRPSVGETRLRRGVKVDNLVQVGHGCDVGEDTLLCSQVGLAGTSKLGRQVVLTGQVGVAGHLTIGDNVIVTPQSGVPNDVEPNQTISGSPAIDHARWLKCVALYAKLPEIYAAFRKAESFLESKGGRELAGRIRCHLQSVVRRAAPSHLDLGRRCWAAHFSRLGEVRRNRRRR